MKNPTHRKTGKAPTEPTEPAKVNNARKPVNAQGWVVGTALPFWHAQVSLFEARWGRPMNPKLKFCAYDVIWVSIDPSFLLLDVNQLTGVKTKAAPLAEGVTEKRHVLGRIDDEGNDLRTPPPQVATMFATALNMEPDFVLAVMPAIRALWLKGSAAACWQTPRRRDFARDLRAPGGESKHAILLGILDDSDPDDRAEDTLAAAAIVAPWLNWTPKDCEEARREHRKTKPHK